MTLVKKPIHQDQRRISFREFWEIQYIHWKYDIPKKDIREAMIKVGKGRRKVYNELRAKGYLNVPNIL